MVFFPFLAIFVSIVYFIASPTSQSLSRRLMVSAHGVAITAVFSAAMVLHGVNHADARYAFPFMFLLVLPVGLIVYSFLGFRGSKVVHLFQIINLLCLVYTFFMGGMAITGDWI